MSTPRRLPNLTGVVIVCCGAWLFAGSASAGPLAEFVQVAVHPTDPARLTARYENAGGGFLQSSDGGHSWRLVCAALMGGGAQLKTPITSAADGATFVGVTTGLWQGSADGCEWSRVAEMESKWVTGLAAHPADPATLYAVTGNGEPGVMNGIYMRDPSGTWSPMGMQDAGLLRSLRVVSRQGAFRFYEVAVLPDATASAAVGTTHYGLRVSDDGGATWAEYPIDSVGVLRIEVVDPTRSDRLLVSIAGDSGVPDRLLLSTDGGASLQDYTTVTKLGGVVMASDGRLWIGDKGDRSRGAAPKGIWTAASLDAPLMPLQTDYGVGCLTYSELNRTLYACDFWKVGAVDLQDGRFTALLDLSHAEHLAVCDGKDVAAVCEAQLCSGLCESTHFPGAPLCSVYSTPTCGPASVPPGPGASGGAGGQVGSGGPVGAGAAAPAAVTPRGTTSSCSSAPVGRSALAGWAWLASCIPAGYWVMRRRRARLQAS